METSNQRQVKNERETEIDLLALFLAVWDEIIPILLTAVAGGILFFILSSNLLTPTYQSTTRIYVLNTSDSSSITYSELQTSAQLTQDYQAIFTTRPVLESVISKLGLNLSWSGLKGKISVSVDSDGRIISITVTDTNPRTAKLIADGIREAGAAQILDIMNVDAVNVVENANFPSSKSSPSNSRNALMGAMLGFCAAAAVVVIRFILDDRVKSAEDVEIYLGLGVLGSIPEDSNLEEKKRKADKKKKQTSRKSRRKS